MTHSGSPVTADGWPGLVQFTRAWATAVSGTCYVPMSRTERGDYLHGLAKRLAAALMSEPFSVAPGYEVGRLLVAADFTAPETLGRTIDVMCDRLLVDLGTARDDARGRLARLLGALATGYSWAVRDRTLDEQEAIRGAALVARNDAEQALRASEARFRHAAMHDPLTGLPNRAMFADRLSEIFSAPRPGQRLGVCFVDLDRFKAVNDSLGHRLGDQLLIAAARRLGDITSESNMLVARLGGDEFVILVENTTCAEDAVKVADRILAILVEPFHIDGHDLRITASVGIVERLLADTDPTDVMRAADITLHWAKADGKARWTVFDADRNDREVARYTLAAAMPGAVERDEFSLVYQPIAGLTDGAIQGFEALARWQHPDLGMLTPDRFINLAEDSGLIVQLGLRLLEQACQQATRWVDLTPTPPFVSVNLAVRQIQHPGLVADIAAVLDRTSLPPERLQLEITESAVMGNDIETVAALHDLSNLRVRLAIDDFGTGYSNLVYLRALPVHGLKLAGQFIQDLRYATDDDPADEALISALVSLGHTLGLTVTAEGVETAEQAERLRAVGCDAGQGWHLGRPASPDHIPQLLATQSRGG